MQSSYNKDDVTFLLTDVTNLVKETSIEEKEKLLQSGVCYSEMLPEEYLPTFEYQNLFLSQLQKSSIQIANYIKILADKIIDKYKKQNEITLISLARAGTPIGILLKNYLEIYCKKEVTHYTISIIRGLGIDEVALNYILTNHCPKSIVFVDGWTGKGAIQKELTEACRLYEEKYNIYLDSELAVLADTGHCTRLSGTRDDFLIPSACLNSTVSGLVSRTFYSKDIIKDNMFHGAKYYQQFEKNDFSITFLNEIKMKFKKVAKNPIIPFNKDTICDFSGLEETKKIKKEFDIDSINKVKPGVGETTRVLLRRIPWKILVRNKEDIAVQHIIMLAKDRNIEVIEYPLTTYNCVGLIKTVNTNEQGV